MTSNGSKPIGVLKHTKISRDNYSLSIGYALPDFQPNRSNFFGTPTATAAIMTRKPIGVLTWVNKF